jgi:branched-chain amino acid transport system substrate-binding protein
MKKTRILSFVLALCMVAALAACGGTSGGTQSAAPASSAPASSAPASSAPASAAPASSSGSDGTSAGGTFKLGGIGPLTGGAAIYGNAAMNGAQIAVDEINAKGGAIQFEFRAEDDVHDPETSVNAYNTLMDWGMQAMVGTVTTGPCIAVSAEANSDRLFMLTPSASSTDVTAGKDMMFQVCFTDPGQGTTSAGYIKENMADSKIAIIYRNDDAYSQGIRDTFAAVAGDMIVYEGTFTEATSTDFTVQLTAAQNAGADLIFLPIYYQPASVILNQAKQMGYAPTFFGVDGMDGILTMDGFDVSLAEGVMLMTPFNAWGTDDLTGAFVKEYQSRFGEVPNQFAADGYDAVYIIYNALEQAGCTADMSHEEICEALIGAITSISVDGLTGSAMQWSSNGEVSKDPLVVVIKDGIYVGV